MAIPKTPAPPSRKSLLRRIRALEARLEEIDDPAATRREVRAAVAAEDPAAEVHELLASGRPLAAARRYREITGATDAEARRAIEELGGCTADDA